MANSKTNTIFKDKILSRCASVSWPGSIVSLIDQLYRSQTERTQVQEGILRYPLTVRWTSLFNGVSVSFCKIYVWSCIIIGLFHIKTANCPLFVKYCALFSILPCKVVNAILNLYRGKKNFFKVLIFSKCTRLCGSCRVWWSF